MRSVIKNKINLKRQQLNNINLSKVKESDNEASVSGSPAKVKDSRKNRGYKLRSTFKGNGQKQDPTPMSQFKSGRLLSNKYLRYQ